MLKYSRNKLIIFDIEEALSFEGETGPYLQYAAVRASNILNKLREREGISETDVLLALDQTPPDEILGQVDSAGAREAGDHDLWAVVFEASGLTKSSNKLSDRWNSRFSPNMRSGWRRPSTRSTIGTRSSMKTGAIGSAGGQRVWPTCARSSRARWT